MPISTIGANSLAQSRILTAVQQPAGAVLQVVQATYSTATSTTSTSFVTTGLSASITPSSSTSKILVLMSMGDVAAQNTSSANAAGFTLYKNGSNLTSNLGSQISYNSISTSGLTIGGFSSTYLDSPATTSSTNYAVFFKSAGASTTVTTFRDNTLGVITLMEIAA